MARKPTRDKVKRRKREDQRRQEVFHGTEHVGTVIAYSPGHVQWLTRTAHGYAEDEAEALASIEASLIRGDR